MGGAVGGKSSVCRNGGPSTKELCVRTSWEIPMFSRHGPPGTLPGGPRGFKIELLGSRSFGGCQDSHLAGL